MRISRVVTGLLVAAECLAGPEDPGRLVRRTDFEVGASWARKPIAGRAFVPFEQGIYPKWGQRGFEKGEALDALPLFRDMAYGYDCGISGKDINDIYWTHEHLEDWRPVPAERRRTEPYGPADMIEDEIRYERPFMLMPYNCRPAFVLHDGYRANRAAYAKWKASQPNFLGFKLLSEYDNDINYYHRNLPKQTNPVVRATLERRLPPAGDGRAWMDQLRTVVRREQALCFGETNLTWGLNGVSCTLAHRYAAAGIKGLIYEAAMNATSGPWSFAGAFTRGAARQFGLPYIWYCAHYVGKGYTRDGKPANGEMEWPGSWTGFGKLREPGKWKGAGRTLFKRQMAYGALIGAAGVWPENAHFFLYADGPDGKKVPSPLAEDYNEIYLMAKDGACGVPYTPVAILSSLYVDCCRHGYIGDDRRRIPPMAFFYTLVPAGVNTNAENFAYHHSDRRAGDLGCLYNSPFGEMWDVVAPDAGQPTADLVKALSSYKAAFLVGSYERETLDVSALVAYMKGGGTLFVSTDQLGFFPNLQAGNVGCGRLVVVPEEQMIGRAHPVWTTKDAWPGLVSGELKFQKIRELLRQVQDETMPVTVEGDCQWGVNFVEGQRSKVKGQTADGKIHCLTSDLGPRTSSWLVWIFNNKGVRKFCYEPEDIDLSKTATVTVTCRETGEKKTVVVKPGDYAVVRF